jgi:hypothetical protein
MPEKDASQQDEKQLTDRDEDSVINDADWKYYRGPYRVFSPAQDQWHIEFPWGKFSGTGSTSLDMQSDFSDAQVHHAMFRRPRVGELQEVWRLIQNAVKSFTDEQLTEPAPVETPLCAYQIDRVPEETSPWTAALLTSEILKPDAESNPQRLREMILTAENTGFTVDQSSRLAPWLLDFAERRRDSDDARDEAVVWAAIRTGASMLAPDEADSLRPLLQPGHSIETSLVALKMLGRIFEAQPPTDKDHHAALADDVGQIAKSLLNRYAITVSKSAAMAHLAIYALAAMASSQTHQVLDMAKGLGAVWFTRRARRKLSELRRIWALRASPVPDGPRTLLDSAIETLGTS